MNDIIAKVDDIRSYIELPLININQLNLRTTNQNIIHDIYQAAGIEHYRLLCLFSTWFTNIIIYELGTWIGAGSICLAYNKTNRVISYDTEYNVDLVRQSNMEFRIGNFKNDTELLKSPFIFVNSNRQNISAKEIYEYLCDNKYKGFTVWDDINLNAEMRKFWNMITKTKRDITRYGHYSGTGIVFFE